MPIRRRDLDSLVDGPNPRTISNIVVGEGDAAVANREGLSGMMYAWGQFLDHDLDLSASDGVTHIDIPIPAGDPHFPAGTSISAHPRDRRSRHGRTAPAHPATAVNSITGWIDASMVYGSDAAAAASLRTADGHLLTSAGRQPADRRRRHVCRRRRARVNENPSLTALQTLFVREHNFQVDRLHRQHPNWTGEQLYQQASAIVGAEMQHITYSEFLPHLLGRDASTATEATTGTVDPTISLEFAGAAFRFGHSIVSNETERVDNLGAL